MLLKFEYNMALEFSEPVEDQFFSMLCLPRDTERQLVRDVQVYAGTESSDPGDNVIPVCFDKDGMGNNMLYGAVKRPHDRFHLKVRGLVETLPAVHEEYEDPSDIELVRYLVPSAYTEPGPAIKAMYRELSAHAPESEYGKVLFYRDKVHAELEYMKDITDVSTTAEDAVKLGGGVCQDFAHVLISLLRMAGIPARYAVGLMQGEGESHAWVEANCRGYWYGIDPTNGMLVDQSYIKFSHGRDYADCMVSRGIFRNPRAEQKMDVSVLVEPAATDQ